MESNHQSIIARDLLQAGIIEAGPCGWYNPGPVSSLLAAPSIVELLRRADAVPPLSPDVTADVMEATKDARKHLLAGLLRANVDATVWRETADRLDALIAAVRADATRAARDETTRAVWAAVAATRRLYVGTPPNVDDTDALAASVLDDVGSRIRAALAAQPAAPEATK